LGLRAHKDRQGKMELTGRMELRDRRATLDLRDPPDRQGHKAHKATRDHKVLLARRDPRAQGL
jgi:hypothetical protein